MDSNQETRNESTKAVSSETKFAQRCALIWYAITSEDVLDAISRRSLGGLRSLGIRIDEQAFRDLSKLLQEKDQYMEALQTVQRLFAMQCSPPPCFFGRISYDALVSELEKGLESTKRRK